MLGGQELNEFLIVEFGLLDVRKMRRFRDDLQLRTRRQGESSRSQDLVDSSSIHSVGLTFDRPGLVRSIGTRMGSTPERVIRPTLSHAGHADL